MDQSTLVEKLSSIPSEALRVYLVLCERSQLQEHMKIGLTQNELARAAGLSPSMIPWTLDWLWDHKFLERTAITLVVNGKKIPYSEKNTDETKIAVLEAEMRRLIQQRLIGEHSGLADIFQGEERDLYLEIENRGYAIDPIEANMLGKMIQKFGVERVKSTYRQMQRAKNPLRASYAALQRGIKGQGAKQVESEPFVKITLRELG